MSNPRPDGPRKTAKATNDTSILMTVEQAAKWSGIPYTTLLQLVHEGAIPHVQPPGKKRYYLKRDVLVDHIDRQWHRESA
jgi:excisionase family DNA binding protein